MTGGLQFIAQHCICCLGPRLDKSAAVLMPFVAKRVFDHEPVQITADWGLRDLQPGMAYTLCNSVQCQDCGALFLDFRFTEAQMNALYRGYRDDFYTRQRDRYEPGYAAVAAYYQGRAAYLEAVERWLEPQLCATPAVLDWGGDSGINTPFLGRSRLTHVVDISHVPTVDGAEAITPEQVRHTHYDLVACSQVLEHVPDPRALLQTMLTALSPGSLLYLEVPHEALVREHPGSLELAPLKRHWHEHINFFTEQALRTLVEAMGLQVLATTSIDVNLGWRTGSILALTARVR